jgi:dTMP kinase
MFVTFEGVDGSGKTTQAERLARELGEGGAGVVLTREPGGTPLGERVREVLLGEGDLSPWAEAALFAAARAELVERVVRPALERGATVISDRYVDSSLAYQGAARGLGVDRVLELNLVATGGLLPDLTVLLDVPSAVLDARLGEPRDRIEREGREFRDRVAEAYRELAARFPQRIVTVTAGGPPDEVAQEVRGVVESRRASVDGSLDVREASASDRPWIEELLVRSWGSTRVVARGRVYDASEQPGLVARVDGCRVGLATYAVDGDECELVTIDAVDPGRGIGTALLDAVRERAREAGCRRLVLITTNDNTDALRFYQRHGFRLAALRPGAVDDARQRLKPEIALAGAGGVPIRDELELELAL